MKLWKTGFSWSMLSEWIFIILTFALVIVNFAGADDTHFRILSVFVLAEGYFHFIMYLRLFDSTAVLVSMLYYIVTNILVFKLIFFITIIAFANMFFVMQGVAVNLGEDDSIILSPNFAIACVKSFLAGFGNFDPSGNFESYHQH